MLLISLSTAYQRDAAVRVTRRKVIFKGGPFTMPVPTTMDGGTLLAKSPGTYRARLNGSVAAKKSPASFQPHLTNFKELSRRKRKPVVKVGTKISDRSPRYRTRRERSNWLAN
jgi:hypothetical protein